MRYAMINDVKTELREDEALPTTCPEKGCGGKVVGSYGLAAGGIGSYGICVECSSIAWICPDSEED